MAGLDVGVMSAGAMGVMPGVNHGVSQATSPAADIRSAAATKGDSRAATALHASAPPPSLAP
jgi:hypothetical protein